MPYAFEVAEPYAQPLSPITPQGDRYSVPPGFTDGLRFLKRFLTKGHPFEEVVHLFDGKLYALTNSIIVDYKIGDTDLPDLTFGLKTIRSLAAFEDEPTALRHEEAFRLDFMQSMKPIQSGAGRLPNPRASP